MADVKRLEPVSTVSLCIIAYNEQACMDSLLHEVRAQDYPHELMEIILVDGLSTDGAKEKMLEFQQKNEGAFRRVVVADNEKRVLPCGWNVVLKNAMADVILRVDAHSSIPVDFVSKNMACLNRGEAVCGGRRPNIIDEDTPFKRTLLMAETSMFGSSVAPYRRKQEELYVKSLFHGAYRRTVFEEVGGYNENLWRTEDNEMNYRIRAAGYRLCYEPEIISYQHTRNGLGKMLKQKYKNGYWIGLTVGVCPQCFSLYHFVPLAFVCAILVTALLAVLGHPLLMALMWSLYGILAVAMACKAIIETRRFHISNLLLPLLFLLLHLSYGAGTLVGLVKLPFWLRKHSGGRSPEVEEIKTAMKKNHGGFQ